MIGLLKKWISGAVTWEEEKKLRTEAETDPFLADALAGYDALPMRNHEETLVNLKQKIQQQQAKKKKKTLLYLRRAIAASVILAASASLFWWTQDQAAMPNLAEKSVPMLEKAVQPSMDIVEAEAEADNIVLIDKQELPAAAILPTKQQTVVPETPKQVDVSTPTATVPASRNARSSASIALEKRKTSRSQSTPTVPAPTLEPIVTTPTNTAPPINAIEEDAADGIVYLEASPVEAAPSIVTEEIVDKPSTESTVLPEQATEIAIADAPIKEDPSYNTSKKVRTRASTFKEARDIIASSSLPSTVEIIEAFQQYVTKNINYPEAAKQANIKGVVQLKFKIKSDGTPKNIKVVKGLGFGCDEEAIRLVKEGPKWLSFGKEGKCEVVFE